MFHHWHASNIVLAAHASKGSTKQWGRFPLCWIDTRSMWPWRNKKRLVKSCNLSYPLCTIHETRILIWQIQELQWKGILEPYRTFWMILQDQVEKKIIEICKNTDQSHAGTGNHQVQVSAMKFTFLIYYYRQQRADLGILPSCNFVYGFNQPPLGKSKRPLEKQTWQKLSLWK